MTGNMAEPRLRMLLSYYAGDKYESKFNWFDYCTSFTFDTGDYSFLGIQENQTESSQRL